MLLQDVGASMWAGGQGVLADRSAQDGMLQVEAAPQPPHALETHVGYCLAGNSPPEHV
jgi:hypothetical protein